MDTLFSAVRLLFDGDQSDSLFCLFANVIFPNTMQINVVMFFFVDTIIWLAAFSTPKQENRKVTCGFSIYRNRKLKKIKIIYFFHILTHNNASTTMAKIIKIKYYHFKDTHTKKSSMKTNANQFIFHVSNTKHIFIFEMKTIKQFTFNLYIYKLL